MGGGRGDTLLGKYQPRSKTTTMCAPIIQREIVMGVFKVIPDFPVPGLKINEGQPNHVALLSSTRWSETGGQTFPLSR